MLKNTKKGSLGVEAAIFLPMLVLGILTIAYIIKINSMEEDMMSIAADESHLLAVKSYTELGRADAAVFPYRLETLINENNPEGTVTDITDFRYRYSKQNLDNLISFCMHSRSDINFPINFYGSIEGISSLTCRAFVGTKKYSTVKGFNIMEEEEKSERVWVFPAAGKRYHSENCTYVRTAAVKGVLNSGIKRKYHSCRLCGAEDISEGSIICYFPYSGQAYHKSTCSAVDKYVIEIEKKEAEKRGYTPCLKCGGG